ncbi:MAG: transcription initiation factor IIB family protein [Methanopyri archaeon]|nr:transcription initiation factor IIB family protein [Methanopyri archaeon]
MVYTEPDQRTCPKCGSTNIVRDDKHGELVCQDCGTVVDYLIDYGPEWRAFNADQRTRRERTGAPISERNPYLLGDTVIDDRDTHGRKLTDWRFRRLKRWARWISNDPVSRNIQSAVDLIDKVCSQANIPESVADEAIRIYRKAVEKDLVRGRSIENTAAAALFMACKKRRHPRTIKEIAELFGITPKELNRTHRVLLRHLNERMPAPDPKQYLSRFASELGVSEEVEMLAREILKKAEKKGLTVSRNPAGLAGAALYLAGLLKAKEYIEEYKKKMEEAESEEEKKELERELNEKLRTCRRTQPEVAKVSGVTEVTIRNRYKELAKELGLEVPDPTKIDVPT